MKLKKPLKKINKNDMKVLAISMQSLTPVNRAVFHELSKFYNVVLYVPKKLKLVGKSFKSNVNKKNDGYLLNEFEINIHSPLIYFSYNLIKSIFQQRKTTYTLICDFEPGTFLGLILRLICIKSEVLIIFIGVDDNGFDLRIKNILSNPRLMIRNIVKRILLTGSKHKNCITTACNRTAINNYKKIGINSSFMPLGYSSKLFKPTFKDKENIKFASLKIGMLGRIVKEKGAHILLKALCNSSLKNYELIIDNFSEYGDSYKEEIAKLIKDNNLEEKINFVEPTHDQMPDLINSLDVVVMPSISNSNWQEQYGRIAVESLACGKLVLASDSGSLPDIIKHHGVIFPQGSVDDLSKILNIIDDLLPKFNSKSISKFAYDNYSDKKQASIINDIIKDWQG